MMLPSNPWNRFPCFDCVHPGRLGGICPHCLLWRNGRHHLQAVFGDNVRRTGHFDRCRLDLVSCHVRHASPQDRARLGSLQDFRVVGHQIQGWLRQGLQHFGPHLAHHRNRVRQSPGSQLLPVQTHSTCLPSLRGQGGALRRMPASARSRDSTYRGTPRRGTPACQGHRWSQQNPLHPRDVPNFREWRKRPILSSTSKHGISYNPETSIHAIQAEMQKRLADLADANIMVLVPPPINGLGASEESHSPCRHTANKPSRIWQERQDS